MSLDSLYTEIGHSVQDMFDDFLDISAAAANVAHLFTTGSLEMTGSELKAVSDRMTIDYSKKINVADHLLGNYRLDTDGWTDIAYYVAQIYYNIPGFLMSILINVWSLIISPVTLFTRSPMYVGGIRPTEVYIPSSYNPSNPAPLLMVLHGYGAKPEGIESYLKFKKLAKTYGFVLLLPAGIYNPVASRYWRATDVCCDFLDQGWNDSRYLAKLILQTQKRLNIDKDSVHIFGHSNGGFMTYRMICDHADLFASAASLAGAMWNDATKCTPTSKVSVLQIHGTNDTTISYDGGVIKKATYPGAETTVNDWITFNGCTAGSLAVSGTAFDAETDLAGAETTPYSATCPAGVDVSLWKIQDGSHVPSFQTDFGGKLMDYFVAHRKVHV